MSIELFANDANTTLAAPLVPSDTALALSTGTGAQFPSPAAGQFFRMTIRDAATELQDEIVFCTSRSGDVCQITRGQEGTSPQSWAAGDTVFMGPTAGTMGNLVQVAQQQAGLYTLGVDTGSANTYQVAFTPAITTLTDGMILKFKPLNANTGVSTLAVNGLPAKSLRGLTSLDLQGGEIKVNGDVIVMYTATGDRFLVLAANSGSLAIADAVASHQAATLGQIQAGSSNYAIDNGVANAYAIALTPVPAALPSGMTIHFKVAHSNTGASTLNVNGLGALPIVGLNVTPLQGTELFASNIATVIFHGSPDRFELQAAAGGPLQVPNAVASQQASTLGQQTAAIAAAIAGVTNGRLLAVRQFATVGTVVYTPTAGTTSVFVQIQGGGGGGGGTPATGAGQATVAGGGGAGGYSEIYLQSGFAGVNIVVGGAGPSAVGGNGFAGGTSSFGTVSATGGAGGPGGLAAAAPPLITGGGLGGSGVNGAVNKRGGQGGNSIALSTGSALNGAYGGTSFLGGGGGATSSGNTTGNAAFNFGAGGGGVAIGQSQAANAGGAGFQGAVIVWEYT